MKKYITDNWKIKVISLMIAIIIWYLSKK